MNNKSAFHNKMMEQYPEVADGNFCAGFIGEVQRNELDKSWTILERCDYNPTDYAMNIIANNWWKAKEPIIRLLSKHPNWDWGICGIYIPKNKAIRKMETDALWDFWKFLIDDVLHNDLPMEKEDALWRFFNKINGQFLDDSFNDIIGRLNSINENYHLRNNMKTSKAILKICREEGWDKMGPNYIDHDGNEKLMFDKMYAHLADCLNPITIEYNSYITVSMADFWAMSIGRFTSCHNIDDASNPGCYSAGTTSYILDDCGIIYWDINESYEGETPYYEMKIRRQMFAYKNGSFMQSRMYPQSMDYGAEDAYKQVRELFQKVIADCLGEPNLWDAPKRDVAFNMEHVDSTGANYPDWHEGNPGSQHCVFSKLKSRDDYAYMVFGVEPICISCGNVFDPQNHENIDCCNNGKKRCEYCGEYFYEEDLHWCEDVEEYRCEDCCNWDDVAGAYFGGEGYYMYRNTHWGREEVEVSEYTFDNRALCCDECGNDWLDDDMEEIDGVYLCPDCMESETEECARCGEIHLRRNMIEFEDNWYDRDCLEELESELSSSVEEVTSRLEELRSLLGY